MRLIGMTTGGALLSTLLCVVPPPVAAQEGGWRANPDVVARLSASRPEFNYAEARVPRYTLPDPLTTASGAEVRTVEEWPDRRQELLELFRRHVYGRSPGRAAEIRFDLLERDPAAMDGAATLKRIAVVSRNGGAEHNFELILFLPNQRSGPAPVFLLLNNRARSHTDPLRTEPSGFWPAEDAIARGYGIAAIQNDELAPDDADRFTEGVIRLFEGEQAGARPSDAWGALAAWGWGASRAMDYFESDPEVDAARVALLGHSRGGKAALWAGAEDDRFAFVISNQSGCGGAALSRRRFGETVARINGAFPHWFADGFNRFNDREDELPLDQHMLVSLIAPRAVYVSSADEDLWADPRGEFLSFAHASRVYSLWGGRVVGQDEMPALDRSLTVERMGYHVRTGGHDLTAGDWDRYLGFADELWTR